MAYRLLVCGGRTLRKARLGGQDGEDAPAGEMPWVRSVRDLDAQEAHAPRTNKGVLMMPEEWFEIAYINFNKAILHGRAMAGKDEFGCRIERSIEQELTPEQRTQVENLSSKHDRQMQALLSSFVDR